MVDVDQTSPALSAAVSPEQTFGFDGGAKAKRPKENGKPTTASSGVERSGSTRADVDVPLNKLHELLQDKWPTYQQIGMRS